MVTFDAEIECFGEMGEKTGWKYVMVPRAIAEQLKPDYRRSFRVRGFLDTVPVQGMALSPMGEGNFILSLKASLRTQLGKSVGDKLTLQLAEDTDFKIVMPEDLEICLLDERELMDRFMQQAKSHQNYFINWINQAKTEGTRAKRIALTIRAMEHNMNYGELIRSIS